MNREQVEGLLRNPPRRSGIKSRDSFVSGAYTTALLRSYPCAKCGAQSGDRCTTFQGQPGCNYATEHRARRDLARDAMKKWYRDFWPERFNRDGAQSDCLEYFIENLGITA
jgi:hypothetical protein